MSRVARPVHQGELEPHVQLVLSDPVDPDGESYGLAGSRQWRFVDLGRRLDFLLAGFGWCRMPEHLVSDHLAAGRLKTLTLAEDPTPATGLHIYAAHLRQRPLGRAGRWLLNELQTRSLS